MEWRIRAKSTFKEERNGELIKVKATDAVSYIIYVIF